MSNIDLVVDRLDGRLHCAVADKNGLADLYADPEDMTGAWGSIYLGRVAKVDRKLDAAIVDLGDGLKGFLPAKHVNLAGGDASEQRTGIAGLVKPGQSLVVQVKSEAKKASPFENQKMPRLTTQIHLTGHHLVYCPLSRSVTMSRHIEREDVLGLAAKLGAPGGWILQPHAADEDIDTLKDEALKLVQEWNVVHAQEAVHEGKPHLLKGGLNALRRALHDYGAGAFGHIHVADQKLLEMAIQWCMSYDPPLAKSKRLRLYKPEKAGQTLFDLHDGDGDMERLDERRLTQADGGSIIIETTHAATVIDVNQGSAPSAMAANEQAAMAAARQILLRNLSGAILIDFIGMEEKPQRARIQSIVEKALSHDAAGAQVHGFTRLGILEVTRRRRTASYAEITA